MVVFLFSFVKHPSWCFQFRGGLGWTNGVSDSADILLSPVSKLLGILIEFKYSDQRYFSLSLFVWSVWYGGCFYANYFSIKCLFKKPKKKNLHLFTSVKHGPWHPKVCGRQMGYLQLERKIWRLPSSGLEKGSGMTWNKVWPFPREH